MLKPKTIITLSVVVGAVISLSLAALFYPSTAAKSGGINLPGNGTGRPQLTAIEANRLKWERDQYKAQLAYAQNRLLLYMNYYPAESVLRHTGLDDPRREDLQARIQLVDYYEFQIKLIENQLEAAGCGSMLAPLRPFPEGSPLNAWGGVR